MRSITARCFCAHYPLHVLSRCYSHGLYAAIALLVLLLTGNPALAQSEQDLLRNGSFEKVSNDRATGWMYNPNNTKGFKYALDNEESVTGETSMRIDTLNPTDEGAFAAINQLIDAKDLQGKRVRFRAAVKTAERDPGEGQAQLWLRVDRPNRKRGAFDNMSDRPVKSDDWDHYEIVVDVSEDATGMFLGMLVIGKCKAWIDDASLEIVDASESKTTAIDTAALTEDAPRQSFFSPWLWLAGLTILLLLFANASNSFFQRFALRFSVVYWIVYCFPTLITGLLSSLVTALDRIGIEINKSLLDSIGKKTTEFGEFKESVGTWTANNVVGIEGDLVSALRNGSGDTTMAYVQLLAGFGIALAVALIWSAVVMLWNRRKSRMDQETKVATQNETNRSTDHVWLRDFLRTYLRYVLAVTMLGYGLAKAGFISTQFGSASGPNEYQLARTYGESSPMGLLWTFMAASPAYTFFAGMGEVIGGVLLVFRRTMTLGAIVTFGVMTNVMMLNFCYDVPVKQYSFHLMIMALIIAMPDLSRLMNVLLFNRATEPTNLLEPPYVGPRSKWVHRILKAVVVISMFVIPIYQHAKTELTHEHVEQAESEHLLMNRGFRWINEMPFNR